jgi:hypothetical protein
MPEVLSRASSAFFWIPACAGMTTLGPFSGMTNKEYYSVSNVKGFLTHYTTINANIFLHI